MGELMSEGTVSIDNVRSLESARKRKRSSAGRTRRPGTLPVTDLSRVRFERAKEVMRGAIAAERSRRGMRDLALQEIPRFLAEWGADPKPLVERGRFLRATALPDAGLVALTREHSVSSGHEVAALYLTDGADVHVLKERFVDDEVLGEWRELLPDMLRIGDCFRPASGDELMRLCDDLSRPLG